MSWSSLWVFGLWWLWMIRIPGIAARAGAGT